MTHFFRIMLRTVNVTAAREFYDSVLGSEPRDSFELHEQALARGATPHWLGFIQVDDVEAKTAAFGAHGFSQLGPKWVNPEGLEACYLRSPGGAIVAVGRAPLPAGEEVTIDQGGQVKLVFAALNTAAVEPEKRAYSEQLGWSFGEPFMLEQVGTFALFSYAPGKKAAGAIGDIAGRPGVHPHWVYTFQVSQLEPALAAVTRGGGEIVQRVRTPSDTLDVLCHDPQGALFALRGA
jgi:predicted enzyme related to lactoylglutathione lyase